MFFVLNRVVSSVAILLQFPVDLRGEQSIHSPELVSRSLPASGTRR